MKRSQGIQRRYRNFCTIIYNNTIIFFGLVSNYLDVSVDIEPVVFAGENDAPILHERHVEALGVLHLALQSSEQLPSLKKISQQSFVIFMAVST